MRFLLPTLAALTAWLYMPALQAQSAGHSELPRRAFISVVIDDIGYRREDSLRALELPGAVTYAVLPHTPHGASVARLAAQLGKEVLLHLPMESLERHRLGPGGITSAMQRAEVQSTVLSALDSVPHASGVSNHMGSSLTRDRTRMAWVMQALTSQPGLYFLDSRTTERSVATEEASRHGIASHSRDVFLDNVRDPRLIRRQFHELLRQARARGHALGIGHPFPETIAVLAELLPQLERYGVELVPVARLMALAAPRPSAPALQANAD